ncbi:hypothetical protein [Halovibrio variabilis]|uniref:hypothetical protein n=1 Tax=Halovibrio variabilis TaxID=31910 RepID=UPI001478EE26|nr:hypothetical protein [Halovibrio variabilis]
MSLARSPSSFHVGSYFVLFDTGSVFGGICGLRTDCPGPANNAALVKLLIAVPLYSPRRWGFDLHQPAYLSSVPYHLIPHISGGPTLQRKVLQAPKVVRLVA